MNTFLSRALLVATLALACNFPAAAGVIINGTRVIYPAQAREVTVQLVNTGDSPALVQAWVDSGNPDQTPETSTAPFVLTPPISRLEAGRGQAIRVIFSGADLPAVRESVFWLNVLEVPPAPDADAAQNYMQVAFRSRIKIFFRPEGLVGTANEAPDALEWRVAGSRLQVSNPSAFHVTVVGVTALSGDGSEVATLEQQGRMLAPGESVDWSGSAAIAEVAFTTVNDYGGRVEHRATVNP